MNYYIADLHLFHRNALDFDNRPWDDVDAETEDIIARWNGRVRPKDHVHLLGDVFWKDPAQAEQVLGRLRGQKHLIMGNHDDAWLNERTKAKLASIDDIKVVRDPFAFPGEKSIKVTLCHYPLIVNANDRKPRAVHLYGHVHMTAEWDFVRDAIERLKQLPDGRTRCRGLSFNVGAMLPHMDYTPRTLAEILSANGVTHDEIFLP